MSPSERDTQQIPLFLILLMGFIDHMGIGLVYPLFSGLLFDADAGILPEGTSVATRGWLLGILIGLTPVSQFFSCPLLGALSDYKGRKKVMILCLCMGIAGYVIAAFGVIFGSIALLFLYRFVVGVSDGSLAVAQAALADISTEENKSRNFALFNMVLGAGFTMGPFIGGKLSDPSLGSWCGYATPFYFSALMSFINLALVLWKFPETCTTLKKAALNVWDGFSQLKKALGWKEFHVIFATMFFFSFGWAFFIEFIPLYLRGQFAFTSSEIGDFYAYTGMFYALTAGLFTGPILKMFAPDVGFFGALTLTGAYMSLFMAVGDRLTMWLYFPLLLFFLALVYPTAATLVSNMARKDSQGEVLGVYHSVQCIAVAISPLMAGSLVAEYPVLTIAIGSVMMLLASGIFGFGYFGRSASARQRAETIAE